MKSAFISIFILIITMGICDAQTTASVTTVGKSSARATTITQNLTQELALSPSQATQVQTLFAQHLQQVELVVESNQNNKPDAASQLHTLVAQRETNLQAILTPQQYTLYRSNKSK